MVSPESGHGLCASPYDKQNPRMFCHTSAVRGRSRDRSGGKLPDVSSAVIVRTASYTPGTDNNEYMHGKVWMQSQRGSGTCLLYTSDAADEL